MSNPIPVFIAALHLTKSSLTHSFKYKAWSCSWYGPNPPPFPPCCWNYYLYINLMHFSAHFTGPYRCGAVISSSFPPFLTPCCSHPFLQATLSPTTLPLKQQQYNLPIPPHHSMPSPTNPPLPRTKLLHSTPPCMSSLQTLRSQHTQHLHLYCFFRHVQHLHILLSS